LHKNFHKNIELHHINEFNLANKYGFDNMNKWAGKADILRYEIVYNYGGMYIDVDSISLKPFDNNFTRPYVCIEISGVYNNLQNAQFGFARGSPFLNFLIKCLNENIKYQMSKYGNLDDILSVCGPPFFTTCFYYWNSSKINCINQNYVINKKPYSYNYHTNDKNW
jgi:mannosyltransferase OCH1-like enzyme